MTNSKARRDAGKIIENILEATDEEYLYQQIDVPIEDIYDKFEFDREAPVTHNRLIRITGDLVRQIYRHSFLPRQIITDSQARAEALAILEEGYKSASDHGYSAAFLDASDPKINGLEVVLSQLAELITIRTRYRYIKWIYATCLETVDWQTKCLVVEMILKRWKSVLPKSILSCTAAQLADYLPELIDALWSSDNIVRKSMNP